MQLHSARHAYYEAKDGKHVFVAMIEPKFWARFCRELGREDLLEVLDEHVNAFDAFNAGRNAVHQRELQALSAPAPAASGRRSSSRTTCRVRRSTASPSSPTIRS
jgi:crotonobetainyl-CoA:carnitine CoA-transferase CaiB-like acyl-CoA transferase